MEVIPKVRHDAKTNAKGKDATNKGRGGCKTRNFHTTTVARFCVREPRQLKIKKEGFRDR